MSAPISACGGCSLPSLFAEKSHVILWLPQNHTAKRVADSLLERHYEVMPTENANTLRIKTLNTNDFVLRLVGILSSVEQADSRILFFSGDMPTLADYGSIITVLELGRLYQGQWLIDVLREKRLFSMAQPIVHTNNQTVYGHEFLVRGKDYDGSVLSPASLFQAATDTRVLFNLDRDARLSAVETAKCFFPEGMIFINFIPGSVYDPNVCLRSTITHIEKNGIDPRRVVFEIVESDKIEDLDHLNGVVRFYRGAGFRIALDDFGAGYNNIGTYLALEPDFVKLDKSLTRGMMDNDRHRDIVESLIAQCRTAGSQIIAEGIEDESMFHFVAETGVDFMQGYHFGYPKAYGDNAQAA